MPGVRAALKNELRLKHLGFSYRHPHHFSLSEWRCPHGVFVAWRVFWAAWHILWLTVSIYDKVEQGLGEKWFIYLTHWSYVLLTLQSIVHLVVVIVNTCKTGGPPGEFHHETDTRWYERLLWYLTAVSFVAATIVTFMYWTFIFKKLTKAVSVMTHAVNSLYVVTDILISASPIRLIHFVHGSCYGLLYAIFSLIYHFAGGTNSKGEPYIYELTDWTSPEVVVGFTLVLTLVATPLGHLCLYGLYLLRGRCSRGLGCGRRAGGEEDDQSDILCVTE